MTNATMPLPLRGEFSDDGSRFILGSPFLYEDGAERVMVPEFFLTDFNSTPRVVWSWFPPYQYPAAGVVHDYLYRHPGTRTRNQCDVIHRRILELLGCRKSKRVAAYLGLRVGGFAAWNKYRQMESADV